jgi:phosphate transport system permease protein
MLAAAVLGFCRALGDTMIALMVSGNSPRWPSGVLESIRALTAHIGMGLATDTHSPEYRSIGAAGLVLFVLTGVLSLAIRSLGGENGEERRVV